MRRFDSGRALLPVSVFLGLSAVSVCIPLGAQQKSSRSASEKTKAISGRYTYVTSGKYSYILFRGDGSTVMNGSWNDRQVHLLKSKEKQNKP